MDDESVATCACSRVVPAADKHPGGTRSEMHRCVDCGARFVRAARYDPQREQTAATILAALLTSYDGQHTSSTQRAAVEEAIELTDALRAALAKGGGQ